MPKLRPQTVVLAFQQKMTTEEVQVQYCHRRVVEFCHAVDREQAWPKSVSCARLGQSFGGPGQFSCCPHADASTNLGLGADGPRKTHSIQTIVYTQPDLASDLDRFP